MDRRKLALGISTLWIPAALASTTPSGAQSTPAGTPGAGEVQTETLITTPPLREDPHSAALSLTRIVYGTGGTLDVNSSGAIALYVEAGSLAIPFEPGQGLALLYSGPNSEPPSLSATDDGMTVVPSGYAVFAEQGGVIPTRSEGSDPLTLLAVALSPELATSESEGAEATATASDS